MAQGQIRRAIVTCRSVHSTNRVRIANRVQRACMGGGECHVCGAYGDGFGCLDPIEFVIRVKAAGLVEPFIYLLLDFQRRGFQMSQIIRAEQIFQGHRALLVEFNNYLPEGISCLVPPEEIN